MAFTSVLCFVCFANFVYANVDSSVGRWSDDQGAVVSLILPQNSEAELLCPTNIRKPSITFLKDGLPFVSRPIGKINKVKNGIKLPGVLADYDKGNYTCIVQNHQTQMTRTFVVDILIHCRCPPEFIFVSENETVEAGDDVELVCRFISGEAAHVMWLKHYTVNGSYVDENNKPHYNILPNGSVDMERLILRNMTVSNTGWYTCVVSNMYGQIQHSAWIEVYVEEESLTGSSSANRLLLIAVVSACGLFAAAAACVIAAICWHRRRPPKAHQLVLRENSFYLQVPSFNLPVDPVWEINRIQLQIGEMLGEGAFGKVCKGYLHEDESSLEPRVVAVKMLKDGATENELSDLLQEMEIMKAIGRHINIINLVGCCTQNEGQVLVIVEYAPCGNLRDFLRERMPMDMVPLHERVSYGEQQPTLVYKDLVSFAYQVARGMEYLSSKKIVHRDLAARNILVGIDSVMKIADFGLTRNVNQKDYYRRTTDGRLPVKWMAPESLTKNLYTTKSDVWSFGILLWEIFSYGCNPYPSVHVEDLLQLLTQGHRNDKPPHATYKIYEIMLLCWNYCPHDRPDFVALVQRLDAMVSESVGMNYLDLSPLPDVDEDAENVFIEAELGTEDRSLLGGAAMPHGSDSQYASLTSSEAPSSPERSVKSFVQDTVV